MKVYNQAVATSFLHITAIFHSFKQNNLFGQEHLICSWQLHLNKLYSCSGQRNIMGDSPKKGHLGKTVIVIGRSQATCSAKPESPQNLPSPKIVAKGSKRKPRWPKRTTCKRNYRVIKKGTFLSLQLYREFRKSCLIWAVLC